MRRRDGGWVVIRRWQPGRPLPDPDGDAYELADRTQLALALGVVALLCGPLGVVAWWVSRYCLRAIRAGKMDPAGEANAMAGQVLGVVAVLMFVVKLLIFGSFVWAFGWPL